MYLSQLKLNLTEPQVNRDLANPYELHRTILRAFPTPLPEQERVLFRVENNSASNTPCILVQSHSSPDWQKIIDFNKKYFSINPEIKILDGIRIKSGETLRFRLRANPSKKVLYAKTQHSQRISLFSEAERIEWLERKGSQCGFEIEAEYVLTRDAPYRSLWIHNGEGTHKATLNMVDYEGLLKVTDSEAFHAGAVKGIGPAKGLGCGLLSFARV